VGWLAARQNELELRRQEGGCGDVELNFRGERDDFDAEIAWEVEEQIWGGSLGSWIRWTLEEERVPRGTRSGLSLSSLSFVVQSLPLPL